MGLFGRWSAIPLLVPDWLIELRNFSSRDVGREAGSPGEPSGPSAPPDVSGQSKDGQGWAGAGGAVVFLGCRSPGPKEAHYREGPRVGVEGADDSSVSTSGAITPVSGPRPGLRRRAPLRVGRRHLLRRRPGSGAPPAPPLGVRAGCHAGCSELHVRRSLRSLPVSPGDSTGL